MDELETANPSREARPDAPPEPRPAASPITVQAQRAGLISLDTGGAVTLAVCAFVLGGIAGGVILPFLTADRPDMAREEAERESDEAMGQLRASLAPLPIWASPATGSVPVSTGLSLGQLLEELEFRAQQSALASTIQVVRDGGVVTVTLDFEPAPDDSLVPRPANPPPHPKQIKLVLASGPVPGSLVLTEMRADGQQVGTGAQFVDLVAMGGIPPVLEDGHILTRRGVFEIRVDEQGRQTAFLDGRAFYPGPDAAAPVSQPATPDAPDAAAANPDTPVSSEEDQPKAPPPQAGTATPVASSNPDLTRLMVVSQDPEAGLFRERLVLVAAPAQPAPCTAKAVIFNSVANTVHALPEPLEAETVEVETGRGVLILRGFCPRDAASPTAAAPSAGATQAATAPARSPATRRYRLEAVYTIATGAISWNRVPIPDVPPPGAAAAADAPTTWRVSAGRLASPIQAGAGLVSVNCAPSGVLSVAASGLPAPADGEQGLSVVFRTATGTAAARMRWVPAARTYELASSSRPRELAAVIGVLRAAGPLTVAGGGATQTLTAPGARGVDTVVGGCRAALTPRATPAPATKAPAGDSGPAPRPSPPPPPPAPAPAAAPPPPAPPQ